MKTVSVCFNISSIYNRKSVANNYDEMSYAMLKSLHYGYAYHIWLKLIAPYRNIANALFGIIAYVQVIYTEINVWSDNTKRDTIKICISLRNVDHLRETAITIYGGSFKLHPSSPLFASVGCWAKPLASDSGVIEGVSGWGMLSPFMLKYPTTCLSRYLIHLKTIQFRLISYVKIV